MGRAVLAIDPGDEHCGMALFHEEADEWETTVSWEETPEGCVDYVYRTLPDVDVLVVEEFRLYPWRAKEQAFSQMKTAEVIGVLRYLHRRGKENGLEVLWVEYPASIKKPTGKMLKSMGIKRMTSTGDHAADAQLHGWRYILKEEGYEVEG